MLVCHGLGLYDGLCWESDATGRDDHKLGYATEICLDLVGLALPSDAVTPTDLIVSIGLYMSL
jgi:hypothetical protein